MDYFCGWKPEYWNSSSRSQKQDDKFKIVENLLAQSSYEAVKRLVKSRKSFRRQKIEAIEIGIN
jgi:hypothetical protein